MLRQQYVTTPAAEQSGSSSASVPNIPGFISNASQRRNILGEQELLFTFPAFVHSYKPAVRKKSVWLSHAASSREPAVVTAIVADCCVVVRGFYWRHYDRLVGVVLDIINVLLRGNRCCFEQVGVELDIIIDVLAGKCCREHYCDDRQLKNEKAHGERSKASV